MRVDCRIGKFIGASATICEAFVPSPAPADIVLSEIVILVHYADLGIWIGILSVLGDDRSFCFEIGIKRHGQREGFRSMCRARAARLELNYDRIANHGCDLSLVSRDC